MKGYENAGVFILIIDNQKKKGNILAEKNLCI